MRLTPGLRVGPYEVVSALGAGGRAEVYRARDVRLGRTVALKVVNEHLSSDPEGPSRKQQVRWPMNRVHGRQALTVAVFFVFVAALALVSCGGGGEPDDAPQFHYPRAVAVDGSGNVYVADTINSTLRKVTPEGTVSTLAGTAGAPGSADGTGAAARFNYPRGVAVDPSGNVYLADTGNNTIRKVSPAGVVSTLAGAAGFYGPEDGTGAAARFRAPYGVAVDASGNVYVADTYNCTVRKVSPAGGVSTLAGSGTCGSDDGTGAAAQFNFPQGVAVDGSGNVYVADTESHTIRKVSPAGVVSTLAGTAGAPGSADGTGAAAQFNSPAGVDVDGSGSIYVADWWNRTVRKVTAAGVVSTLPGNADPDLLNPGGVAVDGSGDIYVADTTGNTIRKVSPAGVVSTLAGTHCMSGSNDGTGVGSKC